MRQTNDKNQIWFERQDQETNIGFTQDFLNSLDQCWHILPANLETFREKSPLLTIETNDALISIVSPIKGNFFEFSPKAQNFPTKLTENDVVMQLRHGPVVQRQEAPAAVAGGALRGINEMMMADLRRQRERIADVAMDPPAIQNRHAVVQQARERIAGLRGLEQDVRVWDDPQPVPPLAPRRNVR